MDDSQISALLGEFGTIAIYDAKFARFAKNRVKKLLQEVVPDGLETDIDKLWSHPSDTESIQADTEEDDANEVGSNNPYQRNGDNSWRDDAFCANADKDAFFPEKGGSTRGAEEICQACDVQQECLDYAIGTGQRFGIWGGMSERERRRLTPRTG